MLILALHISSTPDLNIVQVLVEDLQWQSLLKVRDHVEDVRRSHVQCVYIKEENIKLFLTGILSFITFHTI